MKSFYEINGFMSLFAPLHLVSKYKGKTPACPHCGGLLIKKGRNKAGEQKYSCKNCGKCCIGNPPRIYVRIAFRDMNENINCPYCGSPKLNKKGTSKMGEPILKCKNCGKSSTGNPPRKIVRNREIENNIPCPYCGNVHVGLRGFSDKNLQVYYCPECKKRFTKETTPQEGKIGETCPRCGSTKVTRSSKSRSGKQRFKCLSCNKTYTKGGRLLDKKPLTIEDKRKILMYLLNLNLPVTQVAKHFKRSEKTVREIREEFLTNI